MSRQIEDAAALMRAVGATHAEFHPDGSLKTLALGQPPPPTTGPAATPYQPPTPAEQAREERAESLRLLPHSSGASIEPFMK